MCGGGGGKEGIKWDKKKIEGERGDNIILYYLNENKLFKLLYLHIVIAA